MSQNSHYSEISQAHSPTGGLRSALMIGIGIAAFAVVLGLPHPEGMSPEAWRTAAVAALMALWWIGQAIPVAATALLPVLMFPLLGVATIKEATAAYANPLIFLFMGGFIIALAVERWQLHRRIALNILHLVGTRQDAIIGGMMLGTAALSMWLSNTATTVMMLPIGLSLIGIIAPHEPGGRADALATTFPVALLLGIAYAANIGGVGTLIGTPPNALLAGFMLENYGVNLGFAQWMLVGVPFVVVMLLLTWVLLTRGLFTVPAKRIPQVEAIIQQERLALGPWSRGEKTVCAVFIVIASLWIARPLLTKAFPELGLSDAGIAMLGALSLFMIPVDLKRGEYTMDWDWAQRLPWGVLVLFGGGLSLASAIKATGLAAWIGGEMAAVGHWPPWVFVLMVVSIVVFLTELTSNTATTATFLPVLAALALTLNQDPLLLAIPAALSASCAFMMPVATPPNAIVFSSGHVSIPQMAKAGIWLNLISIMVITGLTYSLVIWVFGI